MIASTALLGRSRQSTNEVRRDASEGSSQMMRSNQVAGVILFTATGCAVQLLFNAVAEVS